jgi:hypothetical protein
MAETTRFTIGAPVACTDGACGAVFRVVVDPVGRTVTHLVVEPEHRHGLGRLVPLSLAEVTADGVRLGCTRAEFGRLELAEETHFVLGSSAYAAYGPGQVLAWAYYGQLGAGRVQGLVIDRGSHLVTHVVLQEGHLRGRREVAIPISAVAGVQDGVRLSITWQEVQVRGPAGARRAPDFLSCTKERMVIKQLRTLVAVPR